MAHEVESMFSVREVPWHYEMTKDATKIIQEAPDSKHALVAAGLDWTVESKDIFDSNSEKIEGYKANTRTSDNKVLGIVSDRYKVVQNAEAFAFTDALIGNGAKYETAGSLRGGKQVWLLAKTEQMKILGDDIDPYICFTNSHDGLGSVRCVMTPIRVVCNNTLNLALNHASRAWSTKHIGNISDKLVEAQRTLELAGNYMNRLNETADQLANTTVNDSQIQEFLNTLFATPEDATDRVKANINEAKESFMYCYMVPDIAKFRNTAWGIVNAASDFATHAMPKRITPNSDENRWANVMNGNAIIDTTYLMMSQLAGITKHSK